MVNVRPMNKGKSISQGFGRQKLPPLSPDLPWLMNGDIPG
jgi:hypothetical protein